MSVSITRKVFKKIFIFSVTLCLLIYLILNTHSSAGIYIAPYITDINAHDVSINWQTISPVSSTIEYGETYSYEKNVFSASAIQHSVTIKNLKPDTVYYYKVDNRFTSKFKTKSLKNINLRFAVIGHTHGTEQFKHFPDELLVSKLKDLKVDFVIHTGDMTYHTNNESFKEHYFELFSDYISSFPVYISPGNHDIGWPHIYGVDTEPFSQLFPYGYKYQDKELLLYTKEISNIRFVFFSYVVGKKHMVKLQKLLEEVLTPDKYNVVVFGGAQRGGYYDRGELLDFLSKINTDMVLNGDGLGFEKEVYKGMPIYFIGTGGSSPHPLLLASIEYPYINLLGMDVSNKILLSESVLIEKGVNKISQSIIELSKRAYNVKQKQVMFQFDLPKNVSGKVWQNVEASIFSDIDTYAWLYIQPRDAFKTEEPIYIPMEFGFRTQYLHLKKGINKLVFSLPEHNPLKM